MELTTYSTPDEKTRQIYRQMGGKNFDRMRTYLRDMKSSMLNQKAMLETSHKTELKMFPMATQLTNDVYKERYENYDTHFVGLLLNSALVTSYSLFEVTFKKVCFYAAEERGIKIKRDHFGVSGITGKYKSFIETDIGINLSEIEEYWEKLVLSRELRNKIVHHSATIPVGNDRLIEHATKSQYIHIKDHAGEGEIEFYIKDPLYVFEFLDIASSYPLWILMRVKT